MGYVAEREDTTMGPDFSTVDSQEKAEALFRQGELEKLYVTPLQFGGLDIPENVLYVPIGVVEMKANIDDNIIAALVQDGKATRYVAEPEYEGKSFVPSAIKIMAIQPGSFETTIKIWGKALT